MSATIFENEEMRVTYRDVGDGSGEYGIRIQADYGSVDLFADEALALARAIIDSIRNQRMPTNAE